MEDAPTSPETSHAPGHRRHRKRRTHKNWKSSRLVQLGIILLAFALAAWGLLNLLDYLDTPAAAPAHTEATGAEDTQ